MNVIIADDSKVVRSIVEKAIKPLGYSSFQANHGGEAIEILEKMGEKIGLILMDWNMPVMDGFDALVKIKKDSRFSSIPIIMLTSESDNNKVKMATDAGAAAYVKKPFTQDELLENIKLVIN
jgi:two-component system chemotaxis response regulator CheY